MTQQTPDNNFIVENKDYVFMRPFHSGMWRMV